ncbi:ribonuclease H-like domain-containing protein [Halolamina salina]|uniref:Ribonuclease H-like domain-containing protein n=1 Tax=Halolamina salina TaxID=1220023 RepID=A0ABD6BA63_9EURY
MIGLTVLPGTTIERCGRTQLKDIVHYFDSEIVFTPDQVHEPFLQDTLPDSVEVMTQPLARGRATQIACDDDTRIVWASTPAELEETIQLTQTGAPEDRPECYILSDQLSVSVDLIDLEAHLDGLAEYRAPFDEHDAVDAFTHLTIEANPKYRAEWDGIDVQGVMPGANKQQGASGAGVAHFELQDDGVVGERTRELGNFGLQAVDQVGRARAATLRDAGIQSRQDLASASVHEISQLSKFGQKTARTAIESAQVIEHGEIRKAPGASLPANDPIFIDIETDGLNPTVIWLIGVYLPSQDDRYMPFIETDPAKPAAALEAFLSWLSEHGANRPIVAYNGWDFDFPVIEEHIVEHCPQYFDFWDSTHRFDLYDWAVRQNNALLPGLTNKLDDVAPALGWDPLDTGLTGAEVGRLFQRYAANPCPATELDWERHKRYCEDDVRALAHIYDQVETATQRLTTSSRGSTSTTEDSTSQGTLDDF